ncbi:sigma-70 family RNA polymerase sigma factor [Geothrix mesophila]|uniref:sigma-70 family RNA polymerase sigma factor n=1 Tax=Geothrix mesophila TaxID=2922723 RepID=UPI001FAD7003|nr:sigma-70 family RNA polymerase sigma factor [Geothrix sp. SG198]
MEAALLTEAFEAHRRLLWSLSYRMTGCVADAEDVVQETYLRALERPPRDTAAPLKPWLVAVAVNLAKDLLRRRHAQTYPGIWLPGPAPLEVEAPAVAPPQEGFDLLESGSYAFLVALEKLTPQQRAVFLLREVFDHSVEETATALGLSAANVKVALHRAKKALQRPAYPSKARRELTQRALMAFQEALAKQDLAALEALFAPNVKACGDGGGVYAAGKAPIVGAAAVAHFFAGLPKLGAGLRLELRELNGLPTQVGTWTPANAQVAPRWTLHLDVDEEGRILWLRAVAAPHKLTALG